MYEANLLGQLIRIMNEVGRTRVKGELVVNGETWDINVSKVESKKQ